MKYLLDTNVLSEPLKLKPDPVFLYKLKSHRQVVSTATPVLHEMVFGCHRLKVTRKRDFIKAYIAEVVTNTLTIFSYDEAAAIWHAKERARLVTLGQTPCFTDGQIASIAYVNDLILVTRNLSDFRIFQGLRVENWHSS